MAVITAAGSAPALWLAAAVNLICLAAFLDGKKAAKREMRVFAAFAPAQLVWLKDFSTVSPEIFSNRFSPHQEWCVSNA